MTWTEFVATLPEELRYALDGSSAKAYLTKLRTNSTNGIEIGEFYIVVFDADGQAIINGGKLRGMFVERVLEWAQGRLGKHIPRGVLFADREWATDEATWVDAFGTAELEQIVPCPKYPKSEYELESEGLL